MKAQNLFLISLSLILLVNCSRPVEEVVVQTEYVRQSVPIQARPAPVNLNDVQWYVVNEENIDQFVDQFKQDTGGELVFVAVSVRGYEALSLNVAELRRYINQQQEIIIYYETSLSDN